MPGLLRLCLTCCLLVSIHAAEAVPGGIMLFDTLRGDVPILALADPALAREEPSSSPGWRRIVVADGVRFGWQCQLQARIASALRAGDHLLATVELRARPAADEPCLAELNLERVGDPWTKSVVHTMVVGSEAATVRIPITVAEDYQPGAWQLNLRLGYAGQTIETGRIALERTTGTSIPVPPSILPGAITPCRLAIDAGRPLAAVPRQAFGVNLNVLEDEDADHRPDAPPIGDVLAGLGMRVLRYPGGYKADHWRWSVPPYDHPQASAMAAGSWPASDTLYGKPDGSGLRIASLDFDRYIAMCRKLGAEPLVVVSAVAQDTRHGPAYPAREELIRMAAAWVRYANVVKGYGIRWWEIGNEPWLPQATPKGRVPPADYAADVVAFSAAMKAVDPTIAIGISSDDSPYCDTVLAKAGSSADFITFHWYPAGGGMDDSDYLGRRQPGVDQMASIDRRIQAAPLPAAVRERMRILITEAGPISFAKSPTWDRADTLRGIFTCDMMGLALWSPRFTHYAHWTTHYRWDGKASAATDVILDQANRPNAIGLGMGMWKDAVLDHLLAVDGGGRTLRLYATGSNDRRQLAVVLINKLPAPRPVDLAIAGLPEGSLATGRCLSGTSYQDEAPSIRALQVTILEKGRLQLQLPAQSITTMLLQAP